ncbi:hypothetical protein ER308_18715 [Egibacter rhizosphaerae]|uniref:Uncharacterized protein n=1 Tax=Egibacter rhizosphaerae TaxID=1670831 RepID=A0A411YJJ3_9ACTN|nr:hypothetical protein [Egibacter rhizosphaerae]QBI21397.1 hypothetical protein ER308_18715 [Egibacter rhizosphaerae]
MSDQGRKRKRWSKPAELIYWGAGFTVIGVMLVGAGFSWGLLVAVPAGAVLLVGLVAKGVQLGGR